MSEHLAVKTALPADRADARRNASEYYLNNVPSSVRCGALNVVTAKTDNPFYCYFQSKPRSSRWSLSLRFPTKTVHTFLLSPVSATRPAYPIPLDLII